jgi:hypothetical protein
MSVLVMFITRGIVVLDIDEKHLIGLLNRLLEIERKAYENKRRAQS